MDKLMDRKVFNARDAPLSADLIEAYGSTSLSPFLRVTDQDFY
jgi:hypothetical protein